MASRLKDEAISQITETWLGNSSLLTYHSTKASLSISKSIDKISGGEKQRVALARALINNPEILIADEPTGNLDATNEQNIIELLKRINEELGITIITVTHSDKVANSMQSICTVVDGKIEYVRR